MNIVFMGTPDFAVATLEALYNAGHNILAVVSQPDKPVGRGNKVAITPTKEFALAHGIKVLQPVKIKNNEEFYNELKNLNPDVSIVVAYGKILPEDILNIPKFGSINVHGSLLPKYRGAAPIQWSIINGDSVTGITTMFMDKGMDTGDMLLKAEIPILPEETYATLYDKLKLLGANLAVQTLERLEAGTLERIKQSDDFTIAPMIFKEDCKIDFSKNAREIVNLIRGVNPAPGAFFTYQGQSYKVWKARARSFDELNYEPTNEYGKVIISNSKQGLFIVANDSIVEVLEIQAPSAKKMSINDYLRGKEIIVDSILNK